MLWRGISHRSNELRDQRGVFLSGRRLDPRRYVDERRAGQPDRLGDVAGIEPTGQGEGRRGPFQEFPIEPHPVAARQIRASRRLGVEQDFIGNTRVERCSGQILSLGDRDSLEDAQARPRFDGGHALGGFGPVQLQEIRLDFGRDRVNQRIVGIDHHGHGLGAPARGSGQSLRVLRRQIARALLEEHKANEISTGGGRRVENGRRPHATDFYFDRHGNS